MRLKGFATTRTGFGCHENSPYKACMGTGRSGATRKKRARTRRAPELRGSPELCYFPFGLLVLTFWVNADAATDLTAAGVRELLNSLAAVDATRAEVCSFAGFFVDMIFSFYSSRKVERRETGRADSRHGWIRQKAASDPDVSANAGTQTPGVRIGTGYMRARRRFSNGCRPWPTPHED